MNTDRCHDQPQNISERGASLVEYSLLVALISLVAIVSVRSLGTAVAAQFQNSAFVVSGSAGFEDGR